MSLLILSHRAADMDYLDSDVIIFLGLFSSPRNAITVLRALNAVASHNTFDTGIASRRKPVDRLAMTEPTVDMDAIKLCALAESAGSVTFCT